MWVEGIQRIVCGVTEKTTCQDVVYALAHATGKTGRFTLIERWRNNERLLAPQEHPLKVLAKWGEYSNDVQFILQRSPLDNKSSAPSSQHGKAAKGDVKHQPGTGQPPASNTGGLVGQNIKKSSTFSGQLNHISNPALQQPAIWKSPPGMGGTASMKPVVSSMSTGRLSDIKTGLAQGLDGARLSPDSGRGSDPTGSDTSNFSDQEKAQLRNTGGAVPRTSSSHGLPPSGYQPPGTYFHNSRFTSPSPDRSQNQQEPAYGYSHGRAGSINPPAYRPPPQPLVRNPSPSDPPPYRDPPPPPPGTERIRGGPPTSPTQGRHMQRPPPHPSSLPNQGPHSPTPPRSAGGSSQQFVRPPHYSPPPHHRELRGGHLARGPSPGRSLTPSHSGSRIAGSPARGHQSSPSRQTPNWVQRPQSGSGQETAWRNNAQQPGLPKSDYSDLMNLVSAQQTRLQSQHAEIKHCDNELKYWDQMNSGPGRPGITSLVPTQGHLNCDLPSAGLHPGQVEAVLAEVARLEEAAMQQEEELSQIEKEQQGNIRGELDQLKHRLEMTDIELQKTNATLRHLGDEMRSYSQEKSKQREEELKTEVERIQAEIKVLQNNSEESATVSDKLSREVKDVESQILARKGEVEQLIQDMKSANLESLTISPPEETKAFLDDLSGPTKPGTTRKMLGSPRQLENAVPTSKNPHGVWV